MESKGRHTQKRVSPIAGWGGWCTQAECVRALKGLALPQAWNAGHVDPTGQSRRSDSCAVAPVLFAHAVVTVAQNEWFHHPEQAKEDT